MGSLTPKTPRILRSPVQTSPSVKRSPIKMHELLQLSPPPYRKSPAQQKYITVEGFVDSLESNSPNNTTKLRRSPRNGRRCRRRSDKENVCLRNGKESIIINECGDVSEKVRKKRQKKAKASTGNKDHLALVLVDSISTSSNWEALKTGSEENYLVINGLGELMFELIMWKDVAKSSLWFGLGTLFFISSSFSNDVSFSMISLMSHVGLFVLGLSFFFNFLKQRQDVEIEQIHHKLTEQDILRVCQIILPIGNFIFAKSQIIFSGEPLMTLMVAPILLLASMYGHLLTLWRLLVIGFFLSFSLPKLYSLYGEFMRKRAVEMIIHVFEAWKYCPHKRIIATSITILFWNLFGLRMRIFAGFLALVAIRFIRQQSTEDWNGNSAAEEKL